MRTCYNEYELRYRNAKPALVDFVKDSTDTLLSSG